MMYSFTAKSIKPGRTKLLTVYNNNTANDAKALEPKD
jgi:hypothetical protein